MPQIEPDDEADVLLSKVRSHVAMLMEHCDTVQILVTKKATDGGTHSVVNGDGCWYSRFGQAKTWLLREEQIERNSVSSD